MIIYGIYELVPAIEELPLPFWSTDGMWVQLLRKNDKEYNYIQLRAAEMRIKWLERKFPDRTFKIIEREE